MPCSGKKHTCAIFKWSDLCTLVIEEKMKWFDSKKVKFSRREIRNQLSLTCDSFLLLGSHEIRHEDSASNIKIECLECERIGMFEIQFR